MIAHKQQEKKERNEYIQKVELIPGQCWVLRKDKIFNQLNENNMLTEDKERIVTILQKLISDATKGLENLSTKDKISIQENMSAIEERIENIKDIASIRAEAIMQKMILIMKMKTEKYICAEKLAVTHTLIEALKTKAEILNKNKPEKSRIEELENKSKNLKNYDSIEQINVFIKKYIDKDKATKAWVGVINEKIDSLIEKERGMEYGVPIAELQKFLVRESECIDAVSSSDNHIKFSSLKKKEVGVEYGVLIAEKFLIGEPGWINTVNSNSDY